MIELRMFDNNPIFINMQYIVYITKYYKATEIGMLGGAVVRVVDDYETLKGKLGL